MDASLEITTEAAVIALSPHRPSFRREEVMVLLESTTWLGRTVALHGLLQLVSKVILSVQTINVIPLELMAEQHAFYDKLVLWRQLCGSPTLGSPTPARAARFRTLFRLRFYPFFHEEPDPKHHPIEIRIQMLMRGTYTNQQLKVPDEDRREGITEEEAYVEAAFYMGYDIAKWL